MKYKLRRYCIYYTAKSALFFIRLIPRSISLAMADALGKIAFRLLGKYRRLAISNLEESLHMGHSEAKRTAEGVFRNLAKNGADWIQFTSLAKDRIFNLVTEAQGVEHIDEALAKGKGAIILASHFGNWELMSIYLTMKGYSGPVVGRRIYFHKYDKFIVKLRKRFGVDVIYRDESPKRMLKVLKKGEMLGMLADQDIDSVEGAFVDFFARRTFTPTAPGKLAAVTGASLVPCFMLRKPDDTFKMIAEEAITAPVSDNKEEDVIKCTQAWTSVLEKYVREYPEQWVWLHSRWKTKEK